jgi:predicted PurR-regulated permease PerM
MLYFISTRFSVIKALAGNMFALITPFIYGFFIAYLVNWVYKFFKETIFSKMTEKPGKYCALSLAYLSVLTIIGFIIAIVTPQIVESAGKLMKHLYVMLNNDKSFIYNCLNIIGINDSSIEKSVSEVLENLLGDLENVISKMVAPVCEITTKLVTELYNWLLGFIISVYLLSSKEKLLLQLKKVVDLFIPKRIIATMMEILKLSHKKVGRFLVTKIVNAFIIGILCFIITCIFNIPYSPLISVIAGITNIIPFLGPLIGAVLGIFIVLTEDYLKAVWFAVFIFVLQQIDANVIGPRLLGSSIGLSGFWIIFSVIIGGGLFGILGMMLGVPIFSVIYMAFAKYVNKKLSYKGINNENN